MQGLTLRYLFSVPFCPLLEISKLFDKIAYLCVGHYLKFLGKRFDRKGSREVTSWKEEGGVEVQNPPITTCDVLAANTYTSQVITQTTTILMVWNSLIYKYFIRNQDATYSLAGTRQTLNIA